MDSSNPFIYVQIGMFIQENIPNVNYKSFVSLKDLAAYLNTTYNTNIQTGMSLNEVLKQIEKAVASAKYNKAMKGV